MSDESMGPKRWAYKGQRYVFYIYQVDEGSYKLCIGEKNDLLGTYSTPTDAAIALAKRETGSNKWNNTLKENDIPAKFREWEPED